MSKKVLLISESQVKKQSIIEAGVDPKVLSNTIHTVQEVQVRGVLGATLYDALLDAVELQALSGTTLSDTHQTLLDTYIIPFLINAVTADFVMVNNYKITNKGLLRLSDNQAANVDPKELEGVRDYYQNIADGYKAKLVTYLQDENLVGADDQNKTDVDTTSNSIGWYL
jgi:hypothetical protein